jgi:hypothetical protein
MRTLRSMSEFLFRNGNLFSAAFVWTAFEQYVCMYPHDSKLWDATWHTYVVAV